MSTGMQPVSTPSASATADQILAAEQIHSIATRTTVAQREPLRTQIMDMQRRMGLSPSLSDGLIGRSTARAVFDITGRRIPNVVMAEVSPVLSPPGAPAPAPVPGAPAAPHGGAAPAPIHCAGGGAATRAQNVSKSVKRALHQHDTLEFSSTRAP